MHAEASQPSCQAVSHVSPSLSQAAGRGQTTLDGFGLSISGSSESVSLNGLLLRMLQHSSVFLSSKESTLTFKRKVTKSGFTYYQLQESAHRIKEDGVLLLPTPTASDCKRMSAARSQFFRDSPGIAVFAAMIQAGIIKLSTPTTSQDFKPIRAQIPSEKNGKHGTVLPGSIGKYLPSLIGKTIHPQFVEWMMGFPAGWTNPDCKLSATQLCQDVYSPSLTPSPELKEVSAE